MARKSLIIALMWVIVPAYAGGQLIQFFPDGPVWARAVAAGIGVVAGLGACWIAFSPAPSKAP